MLVIMPGDLGGCVHGLMSVIPIDSDGSVGSLHDSVFYWAARRDPLVDPLVVL